MGETRRKFAREYKVEAVKLVTDGGHRISQVARDLGISPTLLGRWKREFAGDPRQAFPGKGHLQPDAEAWRRLQRENARLQQELAFLKKRRRTLPARTGAVPCDSGPGGGLAGGDDVPVVRGRSQRVLWLAGVSGERPNPE